MTNYKARVEDGRLGEATFSHMAMISLFDLCDDRVKAAEEV